MRKVTTTHFNWLICRNLQSVLLNKECYLGHLILAAFYCFLLVGNGVSDNAGIISSVRIMSWLTRERDCMYQRGETLWGDERAGNIQGTEKTQVTGKKCRS